MYVPTALSSSLSSAQWRRDQDDHVSSNKEHRNAPLSGLVGLEGQKEGEGTYLNGLFASIFVFLVLVDGFLLAFGVSFIRTPFFSPRRLLSRQG